LREQVLERVEHLLCPRSEFLAMEGSCRRALPKVVDAGHKGRGYSSLNRFLSSQGDQHYIRKLPMTELP
jgi:hypothetical protein